MRIRNVIDQTRYSEILICPNTFGAWIYMKDTAWYMFCLFKGTNIHNHLNDTFFLKNFRKPSNPFTCIPFLKFIPVYMRKNKTS